MKKNNYYHGLGHCNDMANLETSYYSDIVESAQYNRKTQTHPFFRQAEVVNPGFSTDYDIKSLTRLREICLRGQISSRETMGYELKTFSDQSNQNPNNTVCLSKRGLNVNFGLTSANSFISRSLSILISSQIEEDLEVKSTKEIISDNNAHNIIDVSVCSGEYRVIGNIPSKYFLAVCVPFTHISNQRFVNLREYYVERNNEVRIIRQILDDNGILIPIIDTTTHINLESKTSKIK